MGKVGNETKADIAGAQGSSPSSVVSNTSLRHAVDALHKAHPIKHDDLGPHHGTNHHDRHVPLHGLKPTGGKGF